MEAGSGLTGRAMCRSAVALVIAVLLLAACTRDRTNEPAEPLTIGILRVVVDEDHQAFVEELRRHGYSLGTDVRILPADPQQTYDLDGARAALDSWLDQGVDLVLAFSTPITEMVAEVAPDTPTLFLVNDPVAAGFVEDPLRPERMLTGVTFQTPADRALALTDELIGGLDHLGYLAPADDPAVPGHRASVIAAAAELGLVVTEERFTGPEDVERAVTALRRAGVDAVQLANANGTVRAIAELETSVTDASLPVISNTDFVPFAVMIVTPDGAEVRRQLARQAARLLSGADVRAVPVENPRKFLIIVDRGRVQQLGLPPLSEDLLRQADIVR